MINFCIVSRKIIAQKSETTPQNSTPLRDTLHQYACNLSLQQDQQLRTTRRDHTA